MEKKCEKCGQPAIYIDRCETCYKCDDCGIRENLCSYIEGVLCGPCHQLRVDKRIEEFDGDTQNEQRIICPYCGETYGDEWELDNDEGELECDDCGNEFNYERYIIIDYSTSKKG